jgi:hypothetical protein
MEVFDHKRSPSTWISGLLLKSQGACSEKLCSSPSAAHPLRRQGYIAKPKAHQLHWGLKMGSNAKSQPHLLRLSSMASHSPQGK